jgi:hypothetical protein
MKDRCFKELEHVFDKFPKYHMKISLGDSSSKVGREDIFKPTIGNESLHEINYDNGVRIVNLPYPNFDSQKYNALNSTIHKFTWASPNGKTHNQSDHISTDRRRHSSILHVRSFREQAVILATIW